MLNRSLEQDVERKRKVSCLTQAPGPLTPLSACWRQLESMLCHFPWNVLLGDEQLPVLWNTLEGSHTQGATPMCRSVKTRAQTLQPGSVWPGTLWRLTFQAGTGRELPSTYPWSCTKDKKGEATTLVRFHKFSAAVKTAVCLLRRRLFPLCSGWKTVKPQVCYNLQSQNLGDGDRRIRSSRSLFFPS